MFFFLQKVDLGQSFTKEKINFREKRRGSTPQGPCRHVEFNFEVNQTRTCWANCYKAIALTITLALPSS